MGAAMILPDSVLWIDFTRAKTPRAVRQQIMPYLYAEDTVLCDPVRFEVLRGERKMDRKKTEAIFETVPLLPTPQSFWVDSIRHGQLLLDAGVNVPPLDVMIATIALYHRAEVVTFDSHFQAMQAVMSKLKVRVLTRAV
jgi:predicted nucleic acid-binding protein